MGREWLGWQEVIAHPNSPCGGGGPGQSAQPLSAHLDAGTVQSPWAAAAASSAAPSAAPAPSGSAPPAGAPAPKRPKPAPRATPHSLGQLKAAQGDLEDVKVEATIVADADGAPDGGETRFRYQGPTWPGYRKDGHNKIVKFEGKVVWHDTVTIQTTYAAGASPDHLSGYGRGTTDDDVKGGDLTLGFHEQCHRDDYEAYLKSHPLPDPPKLHVGMTEDEYKKATAAFDEKLKAYYKAMEAESVTKTDEVGHRKSTYKRTGKPYVHVVPGK